MRAMIFEREKRQNMKSASLQSSISSRKSINTEVFQLINNQIKEWSIYDLHGLYPYRGRQDLHEGF